MIMKIDWLLFDYDYGHSNDYVYDYCNDYYYDYGYDYVMVILRLGNIKVKI